MKLSAGDRRCGYRRHTLVDRYGIRHAEAASYLLLVMLPLAIVYSPLVGVVRVRRAISPSAVLVTRYGVLR